MTALSDQDRAETFSSAADAMEKQKLRLKLDLEEISVVEHAPAGNPSGRRTRRVGQDGLSASGALTGSRRRRWGRSGRPFLSKPRIGGPAQPSSAN